MSKQPSRYSSKWTSGEDDILRANVPLNKGTSWSKVAELLTGHNIRQCRERWHDYLDPSICNDPFTAEEDAILLTAHAQLGNRWLEISQMLEGRTNVAVKKRYSSLKKCVASGESPTAAPSPNRRKRKLNASQKRTAQHAKPTARYHALAREAIANNPALARRKGTYTILEIADAIAVAHPYFSVSPKHRELLVRGLRSTLAQDKKTRRRRTSCGTCSQCTAEPCGTCRPCTISALKQKCVEKTCQHMF